MRPRCEKGHRLSQVGRRQVCRSCERLERQESCEHDFTVMRWAGILGVKFYCARCDLRDARWRDEFGNVPSGSALKEGNPQQ
jgi:hypothetical protein